MKFNSITLKFSDDKDKKCMNYILERFLETEGKRPFVSSEFGVEISLSTLGVWQSMLSSVQNDVSIILKDIQHRFPRFWTELQDAVLWMQSKLNRPKVQRFSL